jgi:peptidoglycan/xylan/chitin deacetylase (PgdA/CDA1 family)
MFKIVISVLIVASILTIFITLYQPFFIVKCAQKIFPDITFYVPTEKNIYAITFDDGPNPPYTDQILEILDSYSVKATFFLIGNNVKKHPGYIEKIKSRGHQIGNHSIEDKATLFLKEKEFIKSLKDTEALLQQDSTSKIFRPASGWIRPGLIKILIQKKYKIILGSAYVSDTKNPSKWYMLKALKSMLRPGIIIALHDGGGDRSNTVDILPELLSYAKDRKLHSVTINQLLKDN